MKILLSTAFFMLLNLVVQAQFFVQKLPQNQILQNEKAYVVTNSGDTIHGIISATTIDSERLKAFTIKNEMGKTKLKTLQIKALAVIPSVTARFEDMPLLTTLKRASDESFLKIVVTDWVIFERVQLTTKKEKYELMQLVNPGFDSRIKVYAYRHTGETISMSVDDMKLSGGDDDSHYVSVENARPILLRKGKYKKQALGLLYNNCTSLSQEELKWKEFASHIYTYNQACK
ncbi:hypothetical protein [Flexithrix dorotheae]|uniref:hypothetical protein n=1 Tax=Flexithrix dorotheae TaxID=70993 RepID=UPI0003A145E0|nr:hypothetical protein [Flexithrix dorotheae]